jgi:hypothetical protein
MTDSTKHVSMLVPQPPVTSGATTSRSHHSESTSVTKNPADANLFARFMKTSTSANVRAMYPLAETQVAEDASPRRQIGILCRNVPPTERVEILNAVIPSVRAAKLNDEKSDQKDLLHGNQTYDYRKARSKLTEAEMLESMRPLVAVTFYEQNSKIIRGQDFTRVTVPNQIDIRNTLAVQEATFKRSVQVRAPFDPKKQQDDWDLDSEKGAQSPDRENGKRNGAKDKSESAAAKAAAQDAEKVKKAGDPTACGTARFVTQQLDQVESSINGNRAQRPNKRKQQPQQSQQQQDNATNSGSGGGSTGGFALDYMCVNPFASGSGQTPQPQLVHMLTMYQAVTQLLDGRSPTQRLNLRRAVLHHFPNLLSDAMDLRGRPTIHIAEFLTLFLSPEVIPFRSDEPLSPRREYFALQQRSLYSGHHTGRLAEGHVQPVQEETLLLPAVQVPAHVLEAVQPWESIFQLHDTAKSSRAQKFLLLLNTLAATCDTVITEPEPLKNLSRDLSRVRTAIAWLSVLLMQRPHTDTLRPGELFAIRDFLKQEVEREKKDRSILFNAYFGSTASKGGSQDSPRTRRSSAHAASLGLSPRRSHGASGTSATDTPVTVAAAAPPPPSPRMKPTAHFFPAVRFENALAQLEAGTMQMIASREQLPPAAAASLLQECFCLQP